MKLPLDTHALLRWPSDDRRLGQGARTPIADPGNDVLIGVAPLWEIVVKRRVGRLEADVGAIERAVVRDGFQRLAITPAHPAVLADPPLHHRDPFDHPLIA